MKQLLPIAVRWFLAAALLAGCYKDKGNYVYHSINDVFASTTADTFQVQRLDTLKITPSITAADVSRLRYEWRVYPVADPAEPLGIGKIVVISRDRNIHEQILLQAQGGNFYYNLDLVSIDTVTGVNYFKHLHLQVTTAFQTGWVLLEQHPGNMDLSFITPANKIYHDVYSIANPGKPLPASTNQFLSIATGSLIGTLNMVYYGDEGYNLDNTTLEVIGKYSNLFYSPPAMIQPKGMIKPSIFSFGPYTFSGGKLYALNGIYASKLFGTAFTQPDALGYTVAPFAAGGLSFGGIFFDQANHRFLYDGGSTSTRLKAFPINTSMAFDMNSVQKTMVTMKAGLGWDLWPDNWYAIFKNDGDDSCFLYTVNANGDFVANPVAAGRQAILNSPDVQKSPDYLFSSTVKQMYYAADNKLYVYDMAANQSRVIYTFAAGENVTALQMMNNVITLATYNGTAGGGTVYYLPISSTGDITGNQYSQQFTGFDKIICLRFKVG